MVALYPVDKIADLEDVDFYFKLSNGELNSLDISAREYFERQEVIRDQVTKRTILHELSQQEVYEYQYRHGLKDPRYRVPAYVLAYSIDEGQAMQLAFIESEAERDRAIKRFEREGTMEFFDAMAAEYKVVEVYAMMALRFEDMYVARDENKRFKKH